MADTGSSPVGNTIFIDIIDMKGGENMDIRQIGEDMLDITEDDSAMHEAVLSYFNSLGVYLDIYC